MDMYKSAAQQLSRFPHVDELLCFYLLNFSLTYITVQSNRVRVTFHMHTDHTEPLSSSRMILDL